jgi:2-deoxy-D-gluconate 3-dehydrogenase
MPDLTAFQLRDQIAVVTGAASGIGQALALGLADAGCHLALADLDAAGLAATAEQVRARDRRALVAPTDVTQLAQLEALAASTQQAFGRIDILVTAAGWTGTTPAEAVTEAEYDRTADTLLRGTFFTCQAIGKVMLAQGRGKIITIGSTLAVTAFPGRAVYGALKAAVHQLTRCLATEWGPRGVYVNCVAPCITETPTRRNLFETPGYRDWILREKLLTGRWAQPTDHVGAVLFLASPLSDMVLGHVLFVDGGWTIH